MVNDFNNVIETSEPVTHQVNFDDFNNYNNNNNFTITITTSETNVAILATIAIITNKVIFTITVMRTIT